MKLDIILAGVGGQGVLSIAAIIAQAALKEGYKARQSEVHGMAQRGGAVLAHLRLSSRTIPGDLVPKGEADLIISMEPTECLRYAAWLSPSGTMVSAVEPVLNIPNYPEIKGVLDTIGAFPSHRLIETARLAREAGLAKAVNMVMVGAASPFLPLKTESLEETITSTFASKGDAVSLADANLKAFRLGRTAAAE